MKRVFIAIKIELSSEFQQAWQKLKLQFEHEKVRWVPRENLHITLRFIGSVAKDQEEQIKVSVESVCNRQQAFSIVLGNFSYFKRRRKPAVIFVDLLKFEKLAELVQQLNEYLVEVGSPDFQNFKPHLTLGRIKRLRDEDAFFEIMKNHQQTHAQQIQVNGIIFYESILKPEGPEYKILEKYSLQ